jgi:hypothetical protein
MLSRRFDFAVRQTHGPVRSRRARRPGAESQGVRDRLVGCVPLPLRERARTLSHLLQRVSVAETRPVRRIIIPAASAVTTTTASPYENDPVRVFR